MGQITDLVKCCHKIAVEHGWWDEERNDGECIALMHSELSETLEELRKPKIDLHAVGEELSDVLIRIFDWCGRKNIDLEKILLEKIKKNKHRAYKHGGKRF